MRIIVSTVLAFMLASASVLQAQAPTGTNPSYMKQVGLSIKRANEMINGTRQFDEKLAHESMKLISQGWANYQNDLMNGKVPDKAKIDLIKKDLNDFLQRGSAMAGSADKAAAEAVKGENPFKSTFVSLKNSCEDCHKKYK